MIGDESPKFIFLSDDAVCSYCNKKVGIGDYLLTNKPSFMCHQCYQGRTIFPIGMITKIDKTIKYKVVM